MFKSFNFRRANLSVAAGILTLVVGILVFRPHPNDATYQVVVWLSFGVGFATLFFQQYRKDRSRDRSS
jgi:hypothetical protein